MMIKNVLHFPGNESGHWLDPTYSDSTFNIGEKVIIEGDPRVFIVVDVQTQLRREDRNEAGQALTIIMRNVILERFDG